MSAAESAAVAAERYTQARSGRMSRAELVVYLDESFDRETDLLTENAELLLENAELRQRLQRVESALCVAVSERDDARAAASLGRSA